MPDSIRVNLNEVETRQSSLRQTPNTSFGEQFKSGLAQGASVVGNTAAAAGYSIPGASVVGAAIQNVGALRNSGSNFSAVSPTAGGLSNVSGGSGLGSTTLNATGITSGVGGTGSVAAANGMSANDPSTNLMNATQQMTELNQTFNLQYLQLQEQQQQDSREFTALSNVMKSKSDTAKNSLSNIK